MSQLGLHPKDWTAGTQTDTHTMFPAASLPTANRWEPPTCPPTGNGGATGGTATRDVTEPQKGLESCYAFPHE